MEQLDYIIILLYFLGLIAVSVVMSRKIKNSEDMFIAGRNSSWWLSGVSSYMTIFSASTFVGGGVSSPFLPLGLSGFVKSASSCPSSMSI